MGNYRMFEIGRINFIRDEESGSMLGKVELDGKLLATVRKYRDDPGVYYIDDSDIEWHENPVIGQETLTVMMNGMLEKHSIEKTEWETMN